MKRIAAFILAALILSSCATETIPAETKNDGQNQLPEETAGSSETSGAEESDEEYKTYQYAYRPDLPDVGYDGGEFRVLYDDAENTYEITDVFSEELTGEIMNDAAFNRNIKVEDTYDFRFVQIPDNNPIPAMQASVTAGSNDYDLVNGRMMTMMQVSLENYLYNWYDLNYFNPEDPWWDTNCAKDMSYANHLFAMSGDISMTPTDCARFVVYSKGVQEQYHIENLYDLVRSNKWTIDKMTELVGQVSTDKDGNGVYSAEDVTGLLTEFFEYYVVGGGVIFTEKDENDIPTVTPITERTYDVIQKVKALLNVPNCTVSYAEAWTDKDTSGYAHKWDFVRGEYFVPNHFLFTQACTLDARLFYDMEPGYGVLPNPKFDEHQEDYYHMMDEYACIWGIPSNIQKVDMIDVILNAWAANSAELVDAYYERTLKYKRFDAPDDSEMFDIIRGSIKYELSMMLDLGIVSVIRTAYDQGSSVTSMYARSQRMIEKKIQNMFEDFIGD